ncbi:MAG: DUF669 domain-containing protein [Clostridia bacterium]|nr:DUF669 domain-containing protein [Clostridia bacterium]
MDNNTERAFDWNDSIEKDSEFTLLPEGEYDFTVEAFERGRHPGSDKLPACNKAVLTLRVFDSTGNTSKIIHNLFLHSKCEGFLCAFFTAIGQRKHGEKLQMNWNTVIGSRGKCKVYIDKYTGNDGVERQSNKIARFLEPVEPKGWTPGDF